VLYRSRYRVAVAVLVARSGARSHPQHRSNKAALAQFALVVRGKPRGADSLNVNFFRAQT
jgi:hypothetical protein